MSTLRDMIPTILQRTAENKLEWIEYSDSEFAAAVGPMTISIDRYRTASKGILAANLINYRLKLRNSDGKVIDTLQPADAAERETLQDLFERARREAYNVDDSLSALKDFLDKM